MLTKRALLNVAISVPISVIAVVATLTTAAAAGEPADPAPLSAERAKVFWGSAEDAVPKKLGGVTKKQEGRHYVAGNEWNLHLYQETLTNRGGGYVGVGSDQAYLLIGWQRPTLAWLMDYDPVVKDIHHIYFALFAAAKTPAEFLSLWRRDAKTKVMGILDAHYKDDRRRAGVTKRYWRTYRGMVQKRLDAVKAKLDGLSKPVPTFLNDQATYDFIVKLIAAKRVRPMVGNLLSVRGMKGIAGAAKTLGVPVRAVYVSNAEQYWDYTKRYRLNMQGMHVDDKSVLLRTLLTWKRNRDYRYTVQSWANFTSWLDRSWVRSVNTIVPFRKDTSKDVEFIVVDRDVAAAEAARKKRKR